MISTALEITSTTVLSGGTAVVAVSVFGVVVLLFCSLVSFEISVVLLVSDDFF